METLPPELVHCILENLDRRDLRVLASASYQYYLASLPQLFLNLELYVDPYTADFTSKSTQLLVRLYSDRDVKGAICKRTKFVRAITVLPRPGPCFRVTPRAFRTLYVTFFQLLQIDDIRIGLQQFQWRIGCSESMERFPLMFGANLRVLDCAACQIDTSSFFPSLKRLTLRRVRARDGSWIAGQVQQCKLEHLSLSGVSDAEILPSSFFARRREDHLVELKSLELQHMHIDIWPVPAAARLQELTFRYCIEEHSLWESCKGNLPRLTGLTVVSAHDVWEVPGFREMLWSCTVLQRLTLLIGGRRRNIPLDDLRPMGSSLQVLVLEARLFSIAPALNYRYSINDVHMLLSASPGLRVLGISIDLSEGHPVGLLFEAQKRLSIFHLRNWLTPGQIGSILDGATSQLSTSPDEQDETGSLMILGDRCFQAASRGQGAGLILDVSAKSEALHRQYTVPWHSAL